ncbi:18086_t:CDS:2, partial [Gigaspora margarita]
MSIAIIPEKYDLTSEPSPITTLLPSLSFLFSSLSLPPSLSSTPSSLNTNALSSYGGLLGFFWFFFAVIFEDSTAIDVEAVAVVDDVSSTVGDVEAAAAIDYIGGTFDVEVAAAIDDVDNVGSFVAVVVSDIIGVFDLVGVASFDDMGVGAFDDMGVGAFKNTTDLMFLQ